MTRAGRVQHGWFYHLFVVLLAFAPLLVQAQDATPLPVETPEPPASVLQLHVATNDGSPIPADTTWAVTANDVLVDSGTVPASGVVQSNAPIAAGEYSLAIDAGSSYEPIVQPLSVTHSPETTVTIQLQATPEPDPTAAPEQAPTGTPAPEAPVTPELSPTEPATPAATADVLPEASPSARISNVQPMAVGMSCPIPATGNNLSAPGVITDQSAVAIDGNGVIVDDDSDGVLDLAHPWQRIRMDWKFSVSNASPGDYFVTPVPAGLKTLNQQFPITAPDGVTNIACASVQDGMVTVVFTDYAETHTLIDGNFWIDLNVDYQQTENPETYEITLEDGSTLTLEVDGTGPPVAAGDFHKDAWWNADDQGQVEQSGAIHWRVTIPADPNVQTWRITDNALTGEGMWTHDCSTVRVAAMPGDQAVTPTSVTCSPDGELTVTVNAVPGKSLEVHWDGSITEGNEAGPFSNKVDAYGDGVLLHTDETALIVQRGGGGAAGANMVFSKTATLVNGNPATADQLNNLRAGDVVTYRLRVVNTGDQILTNVVITDPLINLNCTFAELTLGDAHSCEGTLTITQAHVDAGVPIRNVGTARSDQTPPTDDDETVTPGGDPAMVFTKTATAVNGTPVPANTSVTDLAVGDVVTYTLTVENTGQITLTNVVVTDSLIDLTCEIGTIDVRTSETCEGTLTITQAHVDAGDPIVNVATATSDQTPPTDDDETVTPEEPTNPGPVEPGPSPTPTTPEPSPTPTEPAPSPTATVPAPSPTATAPSPTAPAPGATVTPTAPAGKAPVSGLPNTGDGSGAGSSLVVMTITMAGALALIGLGIARRHERQVTQH